MDDIRVFFRGEYNIEYVDATVLRKTASGNKVLTLCQNKLLICTWNPERDMYELPSTNETILDLTTIEL